MSTDRDVVVEASTEEKQLNGVHRVLATLNLLGSYPEGIGVNDLAKLLHSPRSSVHRALSALRRADLIEQDSDGKYRLGYGFLKLAFSYYEQLDEVGRIRPVLSALADRFGETFYYATLDGTEVVYLAKIQPTTSQYRVSAVIGGRNPAYCTGLGKALLAYALVDEEAVINYVNSHEPPMTKRTNHTIIMADALHSELVLTRKRKYAVDREENEVGINCVAIPLFLTSKLFPDGAISIAAVAQRLPLKRLEAEVEEVRQIIREHLGEVVA